MDRRAGALVALAACIACSAAAPTASNHTALDLYDGPSEGCYYNFQHYLEGDRIMTNEPCLNCTCHNRMLMCYLRVCPFTKPIGQDCTVEKRADQCCPIVTCPDVPVDLLTSTSTSSPAEYGGTGVGKLDRYGCSINGKYFPEGSKVPPSPNKPCEHCYCIRNMTTCVMQECTLHVDGCTPIYNKDVCCPVRYSCDHPEDEIPLLDDMTTTVRPTPGFLLTTTTIASVTQMSQDCVHDDKIFADGALIKTEKACEHCYCMKGDIVCVVQECGTPMENEGKNCTSMAPREGQCCPDTYICEGDELSNEPSGDIVTEPESAELTTLSPPRRAGVEGSGYRNEDEPSYTEVPIIEPEIEGSGMEALPTSETPEKQPPESIEQGPSTAEYVPHDELSTKIPEPEVSEEATTEPDKGQNTIPDEEPALPAITTVIPEVKHTEPVETTPIEKYDSEYSPTSSPSEDLVTGTTEQAPQKEAEISEHEDKIATTEKDQLSSISDNIEPTTSLPYDKETNSPIELTSEAPVSDNPQTDEQITAGIEPEIKLTTLAEPSRDIDNRESEPGLQDTVSESTSTPTIENASTKQPETEMSSFESEMGLTASLSETDITESPIKVSEESITKENVPATSRPDMETKYTKPTSDNLSEEDHDIKTTDSDLIPEKNDELTTPAIELAPPLEKKPETDLSTPAESDVDQTTPASSPEIKHEDEQSTPSSELDASPEKEHDIDTTLSPEVMTSHEKDLTTPAYESTPTSEKGQEIDVSTQEPNLEPPTEKDQDIGASTSGPESKPPSEIDQDIGSSTPPVELEPPTEKDEDIGSSTSAPELAPENEVDQDNGLTTPAAESVPSVEKNEEPGLSTPVSETSPQSEKDEDSGLSTHTPELPLTKEEGPDTALTTPAAELVPSHDEDKDIDRTSVTELSPSYDKEPNVDLTTPATIPSSDVQKSPEEEQDIYSTTSVSDILPASEKDLDITTPASEIVPLSEKDQEVGLTTPSSETVTSPENEYGTDITTPSIEEATLHEKDQDDKLTTPESNDEKEDKLDVTTPATEHVTTFEKKPDIELTTIVSELTTHLDDTRITTPADSSIIPKKELGEELTTPASELTTTYEKESDFATVSVKEQNVDITTPETEFEMNQDLSTTTASIITSLDERESKPELTTPTSDLTESSHKDEAEITSAPELSTTIPTLSSEHTTSSDIENEIASTITPVVDKLPETTTVSENIEPGRIPGEGDCLLNGITYQNNSHVPSTSKCHSSCSCVSSIIKCDPVICSPPPEYMDNCQPVYDSAESCCPTYVCNDNREPIPPQTHNQVSGTDSPIAPGFECGGGECKKANISEVSDCGSESCEGTIQVHPVITPDDQSQDCKEGKCAPPLSPCNGGECDQPSTQDQPCDSKHGCQALPSKPCVGTECINEPIAPSSDKEEPHICKDPASCEQSPQQTKPICDGTSCASEDRVGAADEICNGETCKPQESAPLPECVGETCTQKKIHDAESQLPCTGQECLEEKPILPIDSTIPVLSTENPLEPSTEEKAPEQDTTSKPYSTAGLEELPVTESEQHTTESNIDISETSSPDKSTSIEQEILSTEKPEDTTRKESVTNLSDLPTSTPQISEVTQEGEVPISELETISSQGDDKTTTEIPKISESDKEIGMEPQEFGERQSTTLSPQDVQQITEINISELPESQEETSTKRVDLKEHPVSDINKVPEESTTVKVESLSTGEESTDIPKVTESEESEDHKTKTTTVKYDIASPDLTVTESATTVVQEGEDKTQHPDSVEYSTEHSTLAPSKQTTASKETITNVMEPEKPICSELECSQETESSQKGASTKSPISDNTDQITETSESPEKSESPADGSNLVEPFTNTPIESETDLKNTEIPDSENVEVTTKVFTNDEITPESHVTVPAEFVSKTTINVGSDEETGIPETYITHDDTKTESYGNIATEPYLETTPEDVSQTEAPISPITDTRRNEDNIVTTEEPKETYDNEIIPESSTKKDIIQSEPQTEPPDTVSQTIEAVTQPQEVKKPELEETDQQTTKVDMDTESQFTTKIPLLDEESKTLAPEIPTQEPILENQDKFTEGPITTTKPESDSFSTIKPLLGSEEPEREKLVPTETYDEKTTELPTVEESSTAIPQSPEQDSATTTGKPSYEPITESEKLGTENPEITTVTEPSVTDIPEVTARVTDEPIAQNTESPVPVVINTQETTTVLTDTHEPHKDTSEPYEDEITTRLPVLSDEVTTSIPESIQEQDITKPTDELGLHKNPTEPSDIENDVVKTEQPYVTEKSGVTVQNEDRSTELPAHHDETPVTTILSIDQSQEGSTESPLPLVTELATESDIKTEPDITETPLVSEVPEVHDLEDKSTEKPMQETDYYTTEIPEEGVDKLHNIDSELPVEPDVSKLTESPQAVTEPTKETTEKSELTTEPKNEYSETTPYLVELEEHTHKPAEASTVSPIEEQVTTESEQTQTESDIDLKEPTDYQTTEPETSSDNNVQTTPSSIITPDTSSESSISSTPSESVGSDSSDNRVGDDEQIFVTTEGAIKTTEYQTVEPIVPVIPEKTLPGSESEPEKPIEVEIPVETPEEFIPVTTKVTTTTKPEDELTTESPAHSDKFTKPEEKPEEEEQSPATSAPEVPKPVVTEPQPTEEVPAPEDDGQFPPSGGYGQEPDYVEEDQAFGPGTCRYGGKVYVSAQQIPRDDPCDFCFCFRSDIICLQQSCPPPIHGCHEEPIQGFCCPRYECPVSMATTLNVTTTTTTTTTTLPPHFLPHAYKGQAQRRGCQIKGHTYKVGEVVRASSGPCLHCTCGGDGQMKCDPKACTPEPMLRQMIAAAVSAKRRR